MCVFFRIFVCELKEEKAPIYNFIQLTNVLFIRQIVNYCKNSLSPKLTQNQKILKILFHFHQIAWNTCINNGFRKWKRIFYFHLSSTFLMINCDISSKKDVFELNLTLEREWFELGEKTDQTQRKGCSNPEKGQTKPRERCHLSPSLPPPFS